MKVCTAKREARDRVMRRNARRSNAALARAASLAARAKRAPRPDLVPDLLPGAMDADVDLPSDVDSVPSEPAAGENLLAEVLGPRQRPLQQQRGRGRLCAAAARRRQAEARGQGPAPPRQVCDARTCVYAGALPITALFEHGPSVLTFSFYAPCRAWE